MKWKEIGVALYDILPWVEPQQVKEANELFEKKQEEVIDALKDKGLLKGVSRKVEDLNDTMRRG